MKLNDMRDKDGATQEPEARRPRHRLRLGQDRRSRRQGPEGALRRRHQRLRGRPDAALSAPAEARLQQHLRRELQRRHLGRIQVAIDARKLDAKATVTAEALVAAGVIRRVKDGVRILADGEIKAKLAFDVAGASKAAIEKIEKAGGSVTLRGAVARGVSDRAHD